MEEMRSNTYAVKIKSKLSFHGQQIKFWEDIVEEYSPVETSNQDFNEVGWGSCEYDGVLSVYHTYFEMRKSLSINEVLEIWGIGVEFDVIVPFEEVKNNYMKRFEDILKEEEELSGNESYYYVTLEETLEKIKIELENVYDSDGLMRIYRDIYSGNLYSAINHLFNLTFKNVKIQGVKMAPGIGPGYNISICSHDYKIGLQCALLKDYDIIKDNDSFVGFNSL